MANDKDLEKEDIKESATVEDKAETKEESKRDIKNLTVTELRKQSRALNAQTSHTIMIGEDEYRIKIDKVFRKTKQHKLLEDLMEFLNEGNNRVEILDLATPYITLLLIKHFTDLRVPDNIDDAIDIMNALTDLEIFSYIVDLMPEDEVVKLYETVSTSVDRMNANIEELMKEAEDVADKVENEEVIKEMLENAKE